MSHVNEEDIHYKLMSMVSGLSKAILLLLTVYYMKLNNYNMTLCLSLYFIYLSNYVSIYLS